MFVILLMLFSIVLLFFAPSSSGISLIEGFILIIYCIIIFSIFKKIITKKRIPKIILPLLFFLIIAFFSVFWSFFNGIHLIYWGRKFIPYFIFLISILSTYYYSDENKLNLIIKILFGFLLLFAINNMINLWIQNIAFSNLGMQKMRRFGGHYYSAIFVSFVFVYIISSFKKNPIYLKTSFLFMCLSLIISFTRTFWISTFFSLIFSTIILIYNQLLKKELVLKYIVFLGLFLIISMLFFPQILNYTTERMLSISKFYTDISFLDRAYELKGIINSSLKNPIYTILGHGLGTKFKFYSPSPFSRDKIGWVMTDYSHNYFGYMFYSTGFLGLILYLLFWVELLYINFKVLRFNIEKQDKILIIAFMSTYVNLFVSLNTAPQMVNVIWNIIFGIIVGINIKLIKAKCKLPPKTNDNIIQ